MGWTECKLTDAKCVPQVPLRPTAPTLCVPACDLMCAEWRIRVRPRQGAAAADQAAQLGARPRQRAADRSGVEAQRGADRGGQALHLGLGRQPGWVRRRRRRPRAFMQAAYAGGWCAAPSLHLHTCTATHPPADPSTHSPMPLLAWPVQALRIRLRSAAAQAASLATATTSTTGRPALWTGCS